MTKLEFINKLPERERKRFSSFVYRLFRVKRNTGFRGVRWFSQGEVALGYLEPTGQVDTYSFHPFYKDSPVGSCLLPNQNAIEWIESEPVGYLQSKPPLDLDLDLIKNSHPISHPISQLHREAIELSKIYPKHQFFVVQHID